MTEETLFHEALAKPSSERAAFLNAACAGQPDLKAAVVSLLAAHEAAGSLLEKPPLDLGQTIISGSGEPQDGAPAQSGEPHLLSTTDYHPRPLVESGLVIAGRYVLQQKIGEGGMGEVWVAKQTEPVKRKVALKLIKTGMDSKAVLQRFEQERQALAIMDHPNIARVLDGGLTPTGQPFFVMELVNGLPLNKFCDEARLTPRQRLELFVPICQAVQHAHQKGIVHRDLKPANILVTMIDARPVPKVIDFGVAKATSGKLTDESMSTQFGAMVGTLEYMSPEQAGFAGEDIDTRADIYSLGVILYELLTGLRPIDVKRLKNAAVVEMIRIIRDEDPSKPSTRLSTNESLPSVAALRQTDPRKLMSLLRGELDWVVMKCLEKQRERRYETANSLARDIQRYLADEEVDARPPSAAYRLRKFVQRHKGQVIAASLVLLTLAAGIVVSACFAFLAVEEAKSSRKAEAIARTTEKKAENEAKLAREAEAAARWHERIARNAHHAIQINLALMAREVKDYIRMAALLKEIRPEYQDDWETCYVRTLLLRETPLRATLAQFIQEVCKLLHDKGIACRQAVEHHRRRQPRDQRRHLRPGEPGEDRRDHPGRVEFQRQERGFTAEHAVAHLALGIVDQQPPLRAFYKDDETHHHDGHHRDRKEQEAAKVSGLRQRQHLHDRLRQARDDARENDQRNAIADAPGGDLLAQPHQEHRAAGEGGDR